MPHGSNAVLTAARADFFVEAGKAFRNVRLVADLETATSIGQPARRCSLPWVTNQRPSGEVCLGSSGTSHDVCVVDVVRLGWWLATTVGGCQGITLHLRHEVLVCHRLYPGN